jgi:DNA-binding MarR family transcriptional regulator
VSTVCSGLDVRALGRVLEVFEQGHHSATELRVLLELAKRREASVPELAQALAERPADLRPAARRLVTHGLARSHHDGRAELVLLAPTASGLATIHRLLEAAAP